MRWRHWLLLLASFVVVLAHAPRAHANEPKRVVVGEIQR